MDFRNLFFEELRRKLNEANVKIEKYVKTEDGEHLKDLQRIFHTIKGASGLVGFENFQEFMHRLETFFKEQYEKKKKVTKEYFERLLYVMNEISRKNEDLSEDESSELYKILLGELPLKSVPKFLDEPRRNTEHCEEILRLIFKIENTIKNGDSMKALSELNVLKKRVQESIEKIKYINLKDMLKGFEKWVFQESMSQGKKVKLKIDCGNVKIKREDASRLRDILVHLVKNAITHGIELPEERIKKGKSPEGEITIRSYLKGNYIYLEVIDDGAGVDVEKIEKKIEEEKLENMDWKRAIFMPGFSTREKVDFAAGRGIGLDAVRTFALQKSGDVTVESEKDKGSKFLVFFKTAERDQTFEKVSDTM
ncbi:Hpt domain-containing protein [Thermosipho ferrireducens]|uniref:histidine kinase n=1 Tax=Thermosipho ferrireducens TaxID=2571116 RepID=A0ABX7SA27_9BACT|nr:ATP-binding protein [Thermosipho ferrireducens]QTA38253.1 Hpt domain-containing protein [Thermosipho ferrireducens]